MRICVVGGGNIGTALACYLKYADSKKEVSLLTNRPYAFARHIKCNDIERGKGYSVELDNVTDDASIAADRAELVFITVPSFAVERAFADIADYVSDGALIGVIPGSGGCEFFFNNYFKKSVALFGFQRVPFIARLTEYGRAVDIRSWKDYSVVGAQKKNVLDSVCRRLECCGLKVRGAMNYLTVSLAPSNPVLHTARIYDIFSRYGRDHVFPAEFPFYAGWTDSASRLMLSMDRELHQLLETITELDTSAVQPLTAHYGVRTVEEMTAKIRGIRAFQKINAPLKKANGTKEGCVVDTDSRFFTEDFPWGLAIMRGVCQLFSVAAPTMDSVLEWYADFMGLKWYEDGKFCGSELTATGIPQRYGIRTEEEFLSYYA